MNVKSAIFLLGIIGFVSCNTPESVAPTPFPVINTTAIVLRNFKLKGEDSCWLSTASYIAYYIGPLSDTVVLDYGLSPPPLMIKVDSSLLNKNIARYENYIVAREASSKFIHRKKLKIEMLIDTSRQYNNGYAVILVNHENDTIQIGAGNQIPLILEAQDSAGMWKPIEEYYNHGCGTGLRYIILPPGEMVCTFAPVTSGSFKTRLRLCYNQNYYSAPFGGSINYRQFESKFDNDGEFKPDYLLERKAANAKKDITIILQHAR